MISSRLDTSGSGPALQHVVDAAWDGLLRAVTFYFNTLQAALQTPNTGTRKRRTRNTVAGAKGSTYTVYDHPSQAGSPPHKITGWLAKNVIREEDKSLLQARVGLTKLAIYGLFLELGTIRMHARPWLQATLDKVRGQLAALIGRG
jgi:hypothetical protein